MTGMEASMAKRKPAESPTHHRKVQRVARELAKQGWKVKVDDVRGYDSPPEIAGRVPDIVATKPGRTRIIEVETSDSYHRHKEQLKTLNRHAAQKKRTSFEVIVTKRKKSSRRRKSRRNRT